MKFNSFVGSVLCLLLVVVCGDASVSEDGMSETPNSNTTENNDDDLSSASSNSSACQVQLSLDDLVVDRNEQTIRINAVATNLTNEPVTLTMRNLCFGLVSWSGVPLADYDYFNACGSGGCDLETYSTETRVLAGNGQETLSTLVLYVDGRSCNEEIPDGTELSLAFSLPLEGDNPTVCDPMASAVTVMR